MGIVSKQLFLIYKRFIRWNSHGGESLCFSSSGFCRSDSPAPFHPAFPLLLFLHERIQTTLGYPGLFHRLETQMEKLASDRAGSLRFVNRTRARVLSQDASWRSAWWFQPGIISMSTNSPTAFSCPPLCPFSTPTWLSLARPLCVVERLQNELLLSTTRSYQKLGSILNSGTRRCVMRVSRHFFPESCGSPVSLGVTFMREEYVVF